MVDDEAAISEILGDILESEGHEVEVAQDGIEALAKIGLDIDLVMLDIMMPGMDGFDVVKSIRANPLYQDIPVIIVTGMTSMQDRIRAVEAGANDFIGKPFDHTEVRVCTMSLLRMKGAHDALKDHKIMLEKTVAKRTEALRTALDDVVSTQRLLREAYIETIHRLVVAAEFKDKGTASHIRRMSQYSAMLAKKINLPPSEVDLILHASSMHDIGKIGTPEEILMKPGKLTESEWVSMREHTSHGAKILHDSSSNLLMEGERIAVSHHEKWDGSGYPLGISGEDIPLSGRICAVADVFDALTSERPYKKAFTNETALNMMRQESGLHFEPELLNIFADSMLEVDAIKVKYQ